MVQLDGYLPYEATLSRKVDGWIAGNIIFGALVGLAIDAITGGMYKLTPEQAELLNNSVNINKTDNIYLFVSLTPNPNWEKIDNLKQIQPKKFIVSNNKTGM